MGSHHHDDDFDHGGEPDDVAVPPGNSDHFGLFDRAPRVPGDAPGSSSEPAWHDDEATRTGELDLDALRDVLAGRVDPAEDDDDLRGPAAHSGTRTRADTRSRRRRPRRKILSTVIVVLVIALIAGGLGYGFVLWRQHSETPTDWAGTGERTVVVRVHSGEGLYDVGQALVSAGVVATVNAFVSVATQDGRLSALQPGYYVVHEHSSAQSVVDDLADPASRVGQMRVIPGQTLADITTVSTAGEEATKPGILSKIVEACVPTTGQSQCFTVDDLWHEATSASLADLNVVGWAVDDVTGAPDAAKRLEGLILPGDYDIAPGSTAFEALRDVVSASASQWNTTGIVAAAEKQHLTPYQLATVASLVQAEASDDIPADQAKVARVIYNRLDDDMKLQFDSTVNYGLDRASISTTQDERLDKKNLYSTYAHAGLTPTPIGAPGPRALDAAEDPAVGDWLYFVAIDLDGNSCFSVTIDDHEKCVQQARDNGVFG